MDSYQDKLLPYSRVAAESQPLELDYCLSMLRMYAHILDKGLQRTDWEPNHSQEVYKNAKHFLSLCCGSQDPTYVWSRDIVAEHERRSLGGIPVSLRRLTCDPPVPACNLMQQLKYRTSTRSYASRQVSQEDISLIAEAALEAASSCHRQTLRIYAATSPELARAVGGCFHGFTAFSAYVPVILVFCADLRPYSYPAEIFTPTLDTGLAVQNAVLMASSLGLSVTLLNWTGRDSAEELLRSLLEIPAHEAIIVGGACGYPDATAMKPVRKPVSGTLILK